MRRAVAKVRQHCRSRFTTPLYPKGREIWDLFRCKETLGREQIDDGEQDVFLCVYLSYWL